jgi:hypothetical protein
MAYQGDMDINAYLVSPMFRGAAPAGPSPPWPAHPAPCTGTMPRTCALLLLAEDDNHHVTF